MDMNSGIPRVGFYVNLSLDARIDAVDRRIAWH